MLQPILSIPGELKNSVLLSSHALVTIYPIFFVMYIKLASNQMNQKIKA